MFLTNDISGFIDDFFSMIFFGVKDCLTILDSITFAGGSVSLLEFSLALILIPVGFSILIAIHSSGKMVARAERRKEK